MRQTQQQQNTQVKSVLPDDPNHALRELIRLTTALRDMSEQETQYLVTNDMLQFAFTQQDKEKIAARYQQASLEFRRRIEEFRGADKGLIQKLEALQNELKDKSESNNVIVGRIRQKATANTKATLFTAQEIGQRAEFPKDSVNGKAGQAAGQQG